jgi:hypothetical protein
VPTIPLKGSVRGLTLLMMSQTREGAFVPVGTTALRALAVIRLVTGFLALVFPVLLVSRTSEDPSDTAPYYAFRMFGIRTVVLGADLLLLQGAALERATKEAVIIHSSDTVCAAIGGIRGDLSTRAARITVAISSVNTALAVLAHVKAKAA